MRKTALFIAVALLFASCALRPCYYISLENVKKPSDPKIEYGHNVVIKTDTSYYEDEYIGIQFTINFNNFCLTLKNLSPYTIEIPWDRVVYIDRFQRCSRVIHSGSTNQNKDYSQVNSFIPSGATLFDILIPAYNLSHQEYDILVPLANFAYIHRATEKHVKDILPSFKSDKEIKASGIIGSTFSLVIPIMIEGVLNEYTFTYKIDDAKLYLY